MTEQYYLDLYEWLDDAYNSAMQLAQPQLAMQYIVMMQALEKSGVVVTKKETIH